MLAEKAQASRDCAPSVFKNPAFPSSPFARRSPLPRLPSTHSRPPAPLIPLSRRRGTAVGRQRSAPSPRSSLFTPFYFSNGSLAHCSVLNKRKCRRATSARLAPAEPGLERSGQKQFPLPPTLHPARGVELARPTPLALLADNIRADPSKTDERNAESRTFRSPNRVLALCPQLSRFHQQHVTVSQLHGGQESHPLGFAGRRWPPRLQYASQLCAPPTARPQEAQNGPASAPDAFAAGKPGLVPLPLHPSPARALGDKQTWGVELWLCFWSPSVYLRLVQGPRVSCGFLPDVPPPPSSVFPPPPCSQDSNPGVQLHLSQNQKQDYARARSRD